MEHFERNYTECSRIKLLFWLAMSARPHIQEYNSSRHVNPTAYKGEIHYVPNASWVQLRKGREQNGKINPLRRTRVCTTTLRASLSAAVPIISTNIPVQSVPAEPRRL
ncbi:hypothetical protein PO909_033066 [Leuciscus waleckii]